MLPAQEPRAPASDKAGDVHAQIKEYEKLAHSHKSKGDLERAIELFGKSLELKKKNWGKENQSLAWTYHALGECYLSQKNYDQAIEFLNKTIALRMKVEDPNPHVTWTHSALCRAYEGTKDYKQAVLHGEKAIEKSKEMHLPNDLELSRKISHYMTELARAYTAFGNKNKAREIIERNWEFFLRNLETRIEKLPPEKRAQEIFSMAMEHGTRNPPENAKVNISIKLYEKYIQLIEDSDIEPSRFQVKAYWELAFTHKAKRKRSIQLHYLDKAARLKRKLPVDEEGSDIGPSYFTILKRIAYAAWMCGKHELAIKYNNMALVEAPPSIPRIIHRDLVIQYQHVGDVENAVRHAQKDIELNRKRKNAAAELRWGLLQLGKCFNRAGEFEKAQSSLIEAFEMDSGWTEQKHFAQGLPIYAELGISYLGQGKLKEALEILRDGEIAYQKVLRLLRWSWKIPHTLGHVYLQSNELDEAIIHFENAAKRIKSDLKPAPNKGLIKCLRDLSYAFHLKGDLKESTVYANAALESTRMLYTKEFSARSQTDRLKFHQDNRPFDLLGTIQEPTLLAKAALRFKGLVLETILKDQELLQGNENLEVARWLDELADAKSRLVKMSTKPGPNLRGKIKMSTKPGPNLRGKKRLEKEIELILTQISASLDTNERFSDICGVDANKVAGKLPPNSTLVEFIKYHNLTGTKKIKTPAYSAILLSSNHALNEKKVIEKELEGGLQTFEGAFAEAQWIPLGPATPIEEELGKVLKWANKPKEFEEHDPIDALSELHRLVMAPILDELPKGTDTLILSPDGLLNFLPFAALRKGPDQTFLAEQFDLLYVSSGRDLLDEPKPSTDKTAVIFADPDFDAQRSEALAQVTAPSQVPTNRGLIFERLEGAGMEAVALEKLLGGNYETRSHLGLKATEIALRQVKSPHILHLATHGFFIESKEELNDRGQEAFFEGSVDNPMRRAGLLLAGAKNTFELLKEDKQANPADDGIVTAEEAAHLDLEGTWLTTLSACSTGSGLVRAGEGVLGLRRAFAQAGTQNLLITLWPVRDEPTAKFMKAFYAEALRTGDAPRAFAKTQRDTLKSAREKEELFSEQIIDYFAPFVLTFRGSLN